MDWSKTRVKPFSNFKCSKQRPELSGYGPKLVDDDYRKVTERPWIPEHRDEQWRYHTEQQRSMGPRYPVKAVMRADSTTIPRAEARILDTWTTRREKGLKMHATGADREKLTVWHDKLMLPNEHLPPIKAPHPSNWRTQYTKDFSAQDRDINKKTRLVPEEGTLDKVTTRQEFSYKDRVRPFMGNRMDEQYKPDPYNKFGVMKMHSQIVFG